jgi:hypothetical protein
VGGDRKGPLAAFIVIAIIAAILLITSVRSQAATAWTDRTLPTPREPGAGTTARRTLTTGPETGTASGVTADMITPGRLTQTTGGTWAGAATTSGEGSGLVRQGRRDRQLRAVADRVARLGGDPARPAQVSLGEPHGRERRLRPTELHGRQRVLHRDLRL